MLDIFYPQSSKKVLFVLFKQVACIQALLQIPIVQFARYPYILLT